ncbi:MAG: FHA domain-containing protein [Anaerolineales bacterium]|nr:FHA domain-containing protein [Anaerolineales bacterium]
MLSSISLILVALIAFVIFLFLFSWGLIALFKRKRLPDAEIDQQQNLSPLTPEVTTALSSEYPDRYIEAKISMDEPIHSETYGLFLYNLVTQEKIALQHLPATLGRDENNMICIPDSSMSMKHALINYQALAEKIYIEDLGSTNGLWVNGKPTIQQVLEHEDQIRLGQTTFTFQNTGYLHPTR